MYDDVVRDVMISIFFSGFKVSKSTKVKRFLGRFSRFSVLLIRFSFIYLVVYTGRLIDAGFVVSRVVSGKGIR